MSSGLFCSFAANLHVFHGQVFHSDEDIGFLDVIEDAIFQVDTGNRRAFVTADRQGVFAFAAGDVLHVDVANGRRKLACVTFAVIEVDLEHRLGDLADFDVSHVDVFDCPSAYGVGFDPQGPVQVRAVHRAALGEDIPGASCHFTADNHATVPIFHLAISNNDIFAGHIHTPTVVVSARLDGDAVIPRVEIAAVDENVPAGFGIAAVVVGAMPDDSYVSDSDICREHGVNMPHGRVLDSHALDQDVIAFIRALTSAL